MELKVEPFKHQIMIMASVVLRFDCFGSVSEQVLFGYEIDVGILGFELSGRSGGFQVMALLVREIVELQCCEIHWRLSSHSLFFHQNRTIRLPNLQIMRCNGRKIK